MRYTTIPQDTFKKLQLNAGILVDDFDPSTGEIGNIIGATTGGVSFTATPEYTDYGEDIDNVPANMMELKKQTSISAELTGTFVTIDADTAKLLAGAADIDALDGTHIILRKDVLLSDFTELWYVGDYSDANTGEGAGFVAIHMINVLSTGGFQLTSNDDGKGNFAFTFTSHFSMDAQDTVPFEIYIKEGSGEAELKIVLSTDRVNIPVEETATITIINSTEFTSLSAVSSDTTICTLDTTEILSGIIGISATLNPAKVGKSTYIVVTGSTSSKTVYARIKVTIVEASA